MSDGVDVVVTLHALATYAESANHWTDDKRMMDASGVADTIYEAMDRIEELEAENKLLNEQMAAIEEMGTESLNALPDCLMRLAPALVENDDLKAKLAKAVCALHEIAGKKTYADDPWGIARTTLAKLKGQDQ